MTDALEAPAPVSQLPAAAPTPLIEPPKPTLLKKYIWVFLVLGLLAVVGSGVLFATTRQSAPLPSASPLAIPSPSPIPSPLPSPVATASAKIVTAVSPKPTSKYLYTLVSDYKDVIATGWNKTSEGGKDGPFGVRAHLTDASGSIVIDQLGVTYQWIAADPSIVTVDPSASCSSGIQPPCPEEHATFVGTLENTGKTTVTVTSYKDGKQISNSYVFNVTIEKAKNPTGPPDPRY